METTTTAFDALVRVGRDLRFAPTIEDRRRFFLRLPHAVRLAVFGASELRARIEVELADYVRHADSIVRDDLESVAWALGKGVLEVASDTDAVDTLRSLEQFIIQGLWAADAQITAS